MCQVTSGDLVLHSDAKWSGATDGPDTHPRYWSRT
jgi:hypothetical protein